MAKFQRLGDRFELVRRILSGDAKRGVPELWQASSFGDLHYARVWRRSSQDDFELRALWNREVRSLTRLHGYPGAGNLFVRLHAVGVEPAAYYAILSGGEYLLLRQILGERQRYPWLQNLAEVNRRRSLWEGLLRIAEALSILHSEGTLHRSLQASSIFCAPSGQGDFRLSGFEWSLRIAGPEGGAARVGSRSTVQAKELDGAEGEYSTATDWFDFGLIAAEIFGAPVTAYRKRDAVREAVQRLSFLRDAEAELILSLLEDDPELRIASGQAVTQAIRGVIHDLAVVGASAGRPLVLAFRLEPGGSLAQMIEKTSRGAARASDPIAQRDWLQEDLKGDLRVIARAEPNPHYIVRGRELSYRIKQWSAGQLMTWEVGFCENIEHVPSAHAGDQRSGLQDRRIEVVLYPYARKHLQMLRDRGAAWDRSFPFRAKQAPLSPELRDTLDFFRITQQIDTVLMVAQICPVRMVDMDRRPTETILWVTPEDDPARNELAQHLKLGPPSLQLKEWIGLGAEPLSFDGEEEPTRDRWSFLDRRAIGHDTRPVTTWRLLRAEPGHEGPIYTFRAEGAPVVKGPVFYLARNYGGTIRQLQRRYKAIEDLRSHEGLLRLLSDPAGAARAGHDDLPNGRLDIPLDPSKVAALSALWRMQPSFALQGPPGTGKTTLIKAFADRLLSDDPSAQMLITAHSHHTVDDVLGKLVEQFGEGPVEDRPIILRLGGEEGAAQSAGRLTTDLLGRMTDSELIAEAPDHLKRRFNQITQGPPNDDVSRERGALEVLVEEAANITCATSNDSELADMAARGRRFDWSIIEEAGKAHGFDMAVALQESHRLLLIGDHKQLPPFNASTFRRILGDVQRVRRAIQTGAQFAQGLIDPSILDEDEGRDTLEERCNRWRRRIEFFGEFFEASAQGEPDAPAATLTDQHRMHPDIAALVGRVFYPSPNAQGTILESPKETHDKFSKAPPYEIYPQSRLTDKRLIWWDVPWVNKTEFAEGETEGLFVSAPEVRGVLEVLDGLRPRGDTPCEVQVLSPYNGQLSQLRKAFQQAQKDGQLSHLFRPPFNLQNGKRMGATVDEFQGSEADVVVVSLVRNNGLPPWNSVGFLKEANRLNVLLSRARHKLVIVGSWDFFESRCDEHTDPDAEYAYVGEMMAQMRQAELAGNLSRIGWAS